MSPTTIRRKTVSSISGLKKRKVSPIQAGKSGGGHDKTNTWPERFQKITKPASLNCWTAFGSVREALRLKHYSIRTEQAYCDWTRRLILFHGKRHPLEMGAAEVTQFLTHLAAERDVAASTQNQALSALLFLYSTVLGKR
ncbi:MAG TPA: phage integrase N-terminal SAM-like domain-containing protein [Chthoniobacterales bacterium]